MKERPIIMSGPMVRAIIEGRKTQTRRLVRINSPGLATALEAFPRWHVGREVPGAIFPDDADSLLGIEIGTPFQPGDHLWVRETFCLRDPEIHPERGWWYAATDDVDEPRWIPSIHMPRAASRILLKITEVRVQRLQEISEADARAEGVEPYCDETKDDGTGRPDDHRAAFADLWNGINAKSEPWDSNPWVWTISFVRVP